MAAVNVIYHHFPHYRAPVMHALVQQGVHDYRFWAGTSDFQGIRAFAGDDEVPIRPLQFIGDEQTGHIRIKGYWGAVADRSAEALIILGNPNIVATWPMAIAGRALGKKVLFWTHGWRRREARVKTLARNAYLGLADRVLLYGHRAATLGAESGFPAEKLSVIYNSLDWDTSKQIGSKLRQTPRDELRRLAGLSADAYVLICSARLVPNCRFELLLEAAARLSEALGKITVVLIGDGPERAKLEHLAKSLKVDARFLGEIYDEETLARLYVAADVTVSPGKVGLTAVHSMSYGIPVITHGTMDEQMPESEAIEPGKTGDFFEKDNVADLVRVIDRWLKQNAHDPEVAQACREVIEGRYNARTQVQLIDKAVSEVLSVSA